MICASKMFRLIDSVSVELICLFWKYNTYVDYLSAEVGK
jgi:hypothetical protein